MVEDSATPIKAGEPMACCSFKGARGRLFQGDYSKGGFRGLCRVVVSRRGVLLTCELIGSGSNTEASKTSGGAVRSVTGVSGRRFIGRVETGLRGCGPGTIGQI